MAHSESTDFDVPAHLSSLLNAVREAAYVAKRQFDEGRFDFKEKSPGDWVSSCDAKVESILKKSLLTICPSAGFWGEEGGVVTSSKCKSGEEPCNKSLMWVVDPIDGTANFIRGIPHFSSVIALIDNEGKPLFGAVIDPCRNESFWAIKGLGAYLGDQPLKRVIDRHPLECLFAFVSPKPSSNLAPKLSQWLSTSINMFGGVRRSGSMALDLAWIAAGRMDAFAGFNLDPWDILAGELLITQVGGFVNKEALHQKSGPNIQRFAASTSAQAFELIRSIDNLVDC